MQQGATYRCSAKRYSIAAAAGGNEEAARQASYGAIVSKAKCRYQVV